MCPIQRTVLVLSVLWLFAAGCTAQTVLFSEDFADNSQGWTLGTEWGIGAATASSGQTSVTNPDPAIDHTPTDDGVAGTVIGGNCTTSIHAPYYLTSPVINTAGQTSLTLSFWRWLNVDYPPYMQATIQVYDGTTWQTVWASGGSSPITDSAWSQFSYDISAWANANMQIRFGHSVGASGSYTVSGWNIDDVEVSVPTPTLTVSHAGPATQLVDESEQGAGGNGVVLAVALLDNGTASGWTVPSITFTQSGTGDGQTDINFLALYEDINANSTWDGPGTDTLAEAAAGTAFSAAQGDYTATLSNSNVAAGTARRFFLVTKLAGTASFNETLAAGITALTGSSGSVSGLPAPAGAPALQISEPNLDFLIQAPFSPVPVDPNWQGSGGNGEVLVSVQVTSEYDSYTLASITFSASGTVDEQAALSFLALYEDTNTNGSFDGPATDTLATAATGTSFDAPDGDYTATLASGFSDFTPGQVKRFFLVCKLSGYAYAGETFAADISSVSANSTRGGTGTSVSGGPTSAMYIDSTSVVILSHGPSNPSARLVGGGSAATQVLAQFRVFTTGTANMVDYIDLDPLGTGDWVNDLDATNGVEVYLDDGSGSFDAGDTLLFAGPGAASISATFTTAVTLPSGGAADFWIVLNLLATAGAATPETFQCEVTDFGGGATIKLLSSTPMLSNVLSVSDQPLSSGGGNGDGGSGDDSSCSTGTGQSSGLWVILAALIAITASARQIRLRRLS